MFDDDEDNKDRGIFLLVLGVLATVLVVVALVAISGDELPPPTVTGDVPEEVVEVVTTTTEAPATTTTTAAPETATTAAPVEVRTMWDALGDSGQAGSFVEIAGALGLQADLVALEDDEGPVDRTLFAPSDAAMAALSPEAVSALVADPEGAGAALVGYHFIDERLTYADLVALDGETITTRTGLPMAISVEGETVIINGTIQVLDGDFEADNGVVHIVDTVLRPPTVNEILDLENIEFETSSATITAAGEVELQKAAVFFTENPEFDASIEGHTDTDGGEGGNLVLSQSRADSVLTFLVANGIDESRLTATGFGETRPIIEDGVENKAASRRIEFVIR